jgi:GNAT superfamily N-acetyltransferase
MFRIEPLNDAHVIEGFSCGRERLDAYIVSRAKDDARRNMARCFVAVDGNPAILGYYTLANAAADTGRLPKKQGKSLGYKTFPTIVIGRLAVQLARQRQGIGDRLLKDAFTRIMRLSVDTGIHSVTVDVRDDEARSFYLKYGFKPFEATPNALYIPLATVHEAFAP